MTYISCVRTGTKIIKSIRKFPVKSGVAVFIIIQFYTEKNVNAPTNFV